MEVRHKTHLVRVRTRSRFGVQYPVLLLQTKLDAKKSLKYPVLPDGPFVGRDGKANKCPWTLASHPIVTPPPSPPSRKKVSSCTCNVDVIWCRNVDMMRMKRTNISVVCRKILFQHFILVTGWTQISIMRPHPRQQVIFSGLFLIKFRPRWGYSTSVRRRSMYEKKLAVTWKWLQFYE